MTHELDADDWFRQVADRARAFGDQRYAQAEAMARQYGAMVADWDRLRTDLTERVADLQATADGFTQATQFVDAARVLAVVDSYQSVLYRMNELRPIA